MGLYRVIAECVVSIDGVVKHYTGPHPDPVQVEDTSAAALVAAARLEAVEPADGDPHPTRTGRKRVEG